MLLRLGKVLTIIYREQIMFLWYNIVAILWLLFLEKNVVSHDKVPCIYVITFRSTHTVPIIIIIIITYLLHGALSFLRS